MKVSAEIMCQDFPCANVNLDAYAVPDADIDPDAIRIIMVAEAPPSNENDYFYAPGSPDFLTTTIQAFSDAGVHVSSVQDLLDLGIYITTATKCGKMDYGVESKTIDNCSPLLEQELNLFPNVSAILAMGDVAIRGVNNIARHRTGKRVIPRGSTYKIRKETYHLGGVWVFPSYLCTGRSYLIEKSKRRMIAEDIAAALSRSA